ncbi:hypothetical protein [Parapedobacter soli]|uniref:hypothetical protein n=1 Tax=Parapedobacter soli TaxID=416955 RepID=UPI0021C7FEA1|nr:hypothetical protein [Parapedobacter soli]
MNKLTIEHLAPYLPYGLEMTSHGRMYHLNGFIIESAICVQDKPILRPLSQLTQEIECNGQKFVPSKALSMWNLEEITVQDIPHIPVNLYELLLKWHFDVFGLIEAGLAIEKGVTND